MRVRRPPDRALRRYADRLGTTAVTVVVVITVLALDIATMRPVEDDELGSVSHHELAQHQWIGARHVFGLQDEEPYASHVSHCESDACFRREGVLVCRWDGNYRLEVSL